MVRISAKGKVKGEYRGVRMRNRGSWVCEIRISNSAQQDEEQEQDGRIWLGSFDSSMKAALAYDFAAFYLRGTKAKLNFPQTPPPPSHSHHYPTKWQIKEAASLYANRMARNTIEGKHNKKSYPDSAAPFRQNVHIPHTSSGATSISSCNSKDEHIDLTHHGDQLRPQHSIPAPLDEEDIEGLCGFLRSHSHTNCLQTVISICRGSLEVDRSRTC